MIYCIVGLSCVGKSTIVDRVNELYKIRKVKQYTTRQKRNTDKDEDYTFLSDSEYLNLEKENKILSTREFNISGNLYKYGIPNYEFDNIDYIMAMDSKGYLDLRDKVNNVIGIIVKSDHDTLVERYKKRGGKDIEDFINRMKRDREEINKVKHDIKYILDNKNINECIAEIMNIINDNKTLY